MYIAGVGSPFPEIQKVCKNKEFRTFDNMQFAEVEVTEIILLLNFIEIDRRARLTLTCGAVRS